MREQNNIFQQKLYSLKETERIVIGIPFDGTVSNRPGARFGPRAIRDASMEIEDYSPYLNKDITNIKIHDAGDIQIPFGYTETTLQIISKNYRQFLEHNKRIIALGGEHLISLPLIEEQYNKYGSDLFVIQFDAHADLRNEYLGVRFSHATVMHHVVDIIGPENYSAIGVRSGTKGEWNIINKQNNYFGGSSLRSFSDFVDSYVTKLSGRKIYITVDIDVFDPSLVSGTGTPEPGGISYNDFIYVLKMISQLDITGVDIVELAPDYDNSGVSAIVGASILREMLII